MNKISENRSFGGWHRQYEHASAVLDCRMRFAVYLPPQASVETPVPVLYWLSGLTCTDENFMQKAGAQRMAAELGIAIVAPDTSPRGDGVADEDRYDLGKGAGFYVNATEAPWSKHYRMYDYVVNELPALVEQEFPVTRVRAISGHSMGGHGALTIALRNPERYVSMSAFSPIANPCNCPWGELAFTTYLGADRNVWKGHDTVELLKTTAARIPALVDQGSADSFLAEQLGTDTLEQTVAATDYPMTVRRQDGYDHSYYFIASFFEDHLRFHADHLKAAQ